MSQSNRNSRIAGRMRVADHHDVAASLLAGEATKSPERGQDAASDADSGRTVAGSAQPRIGNSTTGRPLRSTASATVNGRLPPPQMMATGPPLACVGAWLMSPHRRRRRLRPTSGALRRSSMRGARDARMKSMIFPTSGCPANSRSTADRRSSNVAIAVEQHPIGAPDPPDVVPRTAPALHADDVDAAKRGAIADSHAKRDDVGGTPLMPATMAPSPIRTN